MLQPQYTVKVEFPLPFCRYPPLVLGSSPSTLPRTTAVTMEKAMRKRTDFIADGGIGYLFLPLVCTPLYTVTWETVVTE